MENIVIKRERNRDFGRGRTGHRAAGLVFEIGESQVSKNARRAADVLIEMTADAGGQRRGGTEHTSEDQQ
jgi:hypothetical protein